MASETRKTLLVALGVCLVCSVLVSSAVVGLRQTQEGNRQLDRLKNILIAADLYTNDATVKKIYHEKIRTDLVDLTTGAVVNAPADAPLLSPQKFDLQVISKHPLYSTALPPQNDPANILRRPNFMLIYHVVDAGQTSKIILPVYGKGLWSTLYGFIAFDRDLQTVKGLVFYEHGETPGLGGEIENPRWRQSWVDKRALDADGQVLIEVIKGHVTPGTPAAQFQVDGLSGATLTTRGVNNLVRFWLGENGYGQVIRTLREALAHHE